MGRNQALETAEGDGLWWGSVLRLIPTIIGGVVLMLLVLGEGWFSDNDNDQRKARIDEAAEPQLGSDLESLPAGHEDARSGRAVLIVGDRDQAVTVLRGIRDGNEYRVSLGLDPVDVEVVAVGSDLEYSAIVQAIIERNRIIAVVGAEDRVIDLRSAR